MSASDVRVLPMADHHLARAAAAALPMNPNSRSPWADWFRFMKSMSIVDHGSSRLNCVWRWSERLLQRVQAGDPHLGRREGVHPGDDADARSATRSPPADSLDRVRSRQHRLEQTRTGMSAASSRAATACDACVDRLQGLRPVQMLAAGEEPDLERTKIDHEHSRGVSTETDTMMMPSVPALHAGRANRHAGGARRLTGGRSCNRVYAHDCKGVKVRVKATIRILVESRSR